MDQRGLKIDAVLGETDQGLGSPVLAVASGSVLAGFGNHRSDLDLLVLVDNDRLTRFPVQSHEHGTLIDVNVRQAAKVRGHAAWLRDGAWPSAESVTQDAWNHRRRTLKTTTRLALGLPLAAAEPWDSWQAGLGEPWLARVVEQWWTVEAHRLARAVRLLRRDRPMVAATRGREAVVAALNARAAAGGQLYFTEKWVGEKLRVLGDEAGLAVLREVLAPPLRPDDRVARCLRLVDELVPVERPLHSVLRWATGVGTATLDDRTVVDRWQLRALEVRRTDLPESGAEDVLWSGPPDVDPPEDIHRLFVHDMLWLGVAEPDAEVTG
ncbi:hypothetical protein SAMN05421505_10121 [Sinosporangium album]|uniref:Nucleotidyltransferase domain-containing protein n=1 Tax=Sinosporangium album TaxID=504805 RepID=A0A1G7QK81_9ACTN|nr:hypothetical protein SAMN05421505_10121 [Sinosporangium album]